MLLAMGSGQGSSPVAGRMMLELGRQESDSCAYGPEPGRQERDKSSLGWESELAWAPEAGFPVRLTRHPSKEDPKHRRTSR